MLWHRLSRSLPLESASKSKPGDWLCLLIAQNWRHAFFYTTGSPPRRSLSWQEWIAWFLWSITGSLYSQSTWIKTFDSPCCQVSILPPLFALAASLYKGSSPRWPKFSLGDLLSSTSPDEFKGNFAQLCLLRCILSQWKHGCTADLPWVRTCTSLLASPVWAKKVSMRNADVKLMKLSALIVRR